MAKVLFAAPAGGAMSAASPQGQHRHRLATFEADDTLADLCDTLQEVKRIYINARTCSELGRDENAWCMDVVQPLVRLVLKLHGNGKWWFQSVYIPPSLLLKRYRR